jgi:thiol-disulfide isomerase/thioredoxin
MRVAARTFAIRILAVASASVFVASSAVADVPTAAPTVGAPAPGFEGATLEARPFTVDWTAGDVTVVMFFATYCGPCHRALRELEAIRRMVGPRLRFVLVDAGENPAAVRSFFTDNPLPGHGTVVIDASGNDRRRWGCCELEPTLFLVDHSGHVRYINHGWGEGSQAKYIRRIRNVTSPG